MPEAISYDYQMVSAIKNKQRHLLVDWKQATGHRRRRQGHEQLRGKTGHGRAQHRRWHSVWPCAVASSSVTCR
jgi:hypothetical protein